MTQKLKRPGTEGSPVPSRKRRWKEVPHPPTPDWSVCSKLPWKHRGNSDPGVTRVKRKNCDVNGLSLLSLSKRTKGKSQAANLEGADPTWGEPEGAPQPWGGHALAGRAHGLRQSAPASPLLPWDLPPVGSQTLGIMTLSCPLPGGFSNLPRPGGANLCSKPIPAPRGLGAGCSFLYLRGGHHALALRKARKLGCLWGSEEGVQFGGCREDTSSLLPLLPAPGSVPTGRPSGL